MVIKQLNYRLSRYTSTVIRSNLECYLLEKSLAILAIDPIYSQEDIPILELSLWNKYANIITNL